MCSWARSRNLNDASKFRYDRKIAATPGGLTAREQTSMLVCRGEVREFGLTGLTRNQVSLTAPGVRIPPSPPPSLYCLPTIRRRRQIGACAGRLAPLVAPGRASNPSKLLPGSNTRPVPVGEQSRLDQVSNDVASALVDG